MFLFHLFFSSVGSWLGIRNSSSRMGKGRLGGLRVRIDDVDKPFCSNFNNLSYNLFSFSTWLKIPKFEYIYIKMIMYIGESSASIESIRFSHIYIFQMVDLRCNTFEMICMFSRHKVRRDVIINMLRFWYGHSLLNCYAIYLFLFLSSPSFYDIVKWNMYQSG